MPRPSRRSIAATASPNSPVRKTRPRKSAVKDEPEQSPQDDHMDVDNDGDDDRLDAADDDKAATPDPGPSKRSRAPKRRASTTKARRGRGKTAESDEEATPNQSRRRTSKQVSYKEIPVDADEQEDNDEDEAPVVENGDDDDDDEEDDDEDEEEEEVVVKKPARGTPGRRGRPRTVNKDKDGDKPYKREPGTGGRGGFSVKGAAAAAARARWDKVRRERAERGEDSEPTGPKRRQSAPVKKDPRGALENVIVGQKYIVKGTEYTAADDELILPDDPKGDQKIDAEGQLLGGREWKLVTFTSPTRKNPKRVYALTIDAARACGYTDSLAFLRRCPQIVKLSCDPSEREMLIEVGRITGNLKHRMVTMVAMRNVYKLMGARLIKGGKWVDDDYNEEQAAADCEANGYVPHTAVLDEELAANQYPSAGGPGRPPAASGLSDAAAMKMSALSSFYTVGGPTTHFGGNGIDPWNDLTHGRRGRLRALGVTEEDWILRTAEEARRIDETLRGYRDERISALEGVDATYGWVYAAEQRSLGEANTANGKEQTPGPVKQKEEVPGSVKVLPHPLAQEVSLNDPPSEPLTPAPNEPSVSTAPTEEALAEVNKAVLNRTPGGKIVVEAADDTENGLPTNMGWEVGVIRAAYEPHTQLPHIPIRTQPSIGSMTRMTYQPLLGLNGAARLSNAQGIASVEYVFDPSQEAKSDAGPDLFLSFGDGLHGRQVVKRRRELVSEAEEWERASRAKLRQKREQERAEKAAARASSVVGSTPAHVPGSVAASTPAA